MAKGRVGSAIGIAFPIRTSSFRSMGYVRTDFATSKWNNSKKFDIFAGPL
jgi:hypothetical protein